MFSNIFVKCFTIILMVIICVVSYDQPGESIIFPTTFIRQDSLRAFDLLSNNAVSSESVVELSRAAEAFTLEYFQVIESVICKNPFFFQLNFLFRKTICCIRTPVITDIQYIFDNFFSICLDLNRGMSIM